MKEALRNLLLANATLSGLVGSRIYANRWPQAFTRPALCMFLISDGRDDYHDGADDWRDVRVQIDVIAETVESQEAVSEAVISCLTGMAAQHVQGTTTFTRPVLENAIDYNDDAPGRSDFRKSIDFLISYKK